MKQCPLCHRTYSDQLSYCLDDGSVLVLHSDPEKTLVYPSPQPPAPSRREGNWVVKVFGVVLAIFVLGVVGLLIGGLWWATRENQTASQNVNSAPRPLTSSPSATPDAISLLTGSPSPSPTQPIEQTIVPGTYECEFTRKLKSEDREATATLRVQVTFSVDGTYFEQGYMTVHGTSVDNQLGIEEKGNYSHSDGLLILTDQLMREYNLDTNTWSAWAPPAEGKESHEKIRNVTATTFQLYYDEEKGWFTFSKL